MEDLKQLLASHGHRLTAARKQVFTVLSQAHQPLSVAELHRACPKIDRTSVYRVVKAFLTLSIVTEVPRGWKVRYELAEPFKAHHHHLQCQKCGAVVALDTPELEAMINKIASNHSYTLTSHHIELTGVCKNCR